MEEELLNLYHIQRKIIVVKRRYNSECNYIKISNEQVHNQVNNKN